MLVLSRKANEGIMIGHDIEVVILEVRGNNVRLGIKAPREISVVRTELCQRLVHDKKEPGGPVNRLPLIPSASDVSGQFASLFW